MGTLQRLCTGAGASVAALGVTVLFGWVLDVDPLKTVVPGFESMKVNTALSLLLLGTGLAIRSRHPQVGGWKLGTARALSGLAVFLGSSTLLVDILQVTNPLDELVIPDDTQTLTGVPGRMSPLTALSFILLGSALILPWEKPRQVQATRLLAGATVFVLLFPAFGYAYNATELLGAVRASTGMAVHTLVGLSVLAAGVLLAPSVEGEALFLASSKPAARLLRILSVLIILGPVGVASGLLFLRFTGWVPPGLLAPLGSVAVAVLFSGVLLWAARSLAHLDHAREGLLGDLEQERDLLDRRVSERTQELQASNEELEASNEELRVTTEELTEANRSLAAARADLEAMVQEVRDHAIYQIDPVGRVVTWNQGGQRIHGFEASEALGMAFETVFPIDRRAKRVPERLLAEAKSTGRAQDEGWYQRKDGATFWAETSLSRIDQEEGFTGFTCVTRDATERKRLEDALRTSNQELDEFAYAAAHDLKQPLRAVKVYAGFLKEDHGAELSEDAMEHISRIAASTDRATQLVEDLLAYARLRSEPPPPTMVNTQDILEEVLQDLSEQIEATAARVDHDPLPPVWASKTEVFEIWSNLLGNALKFHEPGEPPQVHVSGSREEGFVHLTVKDDGIGIPPEHRKEVFGVFRHLNPYDVYPGSGIGLAVVARIAQRYGGRAWIDEDDAGWTTVHVRLPAAPLPDGPQHIDPSQEPSASAS